MSDLLDTDLPRAEPDPSQADQPARTWPGRFAAAWKRDRSLTAAQFVECHPEIARNASLLAILTYEEFCQRREAGEPVDSQVFFAESPNFGDGKDYFEIQRYVANRPSLLVDLPGLPPEVIERLPELRGVFSESVAKPPPSAMIEWPAVGEVVAGFELLEVLGTGGFSRVYLAEELELGRRQVVVKAAAGGSKEADTLGKLRHPNIVPVFSVRFDPQLHLTLICMPFLGRVTLDRVQQRLFHAGRPPRYGDDLVAALVSADKDSGGDHDSQSRGGDHDSQSRGGDRGEQTVKADRVDPRLADGLYVDAVVHLGVQLADALYHANCKQICHRDLKPSNVLIESRGKPMLLDFNLSHDERVQPRGWGGTLAYMAPELVKRVCERSKNDVEPTTDPRSDLYSLAVILYELLSGEHPFGGVPEKNLNAQAAAELYSRQQGPLVPLWQRNADVEPALSAFIDCCLSFDPDGRPDTAHAMALALRRLASWPGRLKRSAWRHRRAVTVSLVPLSAALAVGGVVMATQPPYAERQFLAAEAAQQRGDYPGVLTQLDVAESKGFDGRQVAKLRQSAYYGLAQQAFATGDFLSARDHCTNAIDTAEATWQTFLLRARSQLHLREVTLAFEDITKAEVCHPSAEIHAVRGDCFCAMSKWKSAITSYHSAIQSGFESAGLMNNLAYALVNAGHRNEATEWLDRAIATDGTMVDAYYQRAWLLAALAVQEGRPVPLQTVADIEKAIHLLPSNYRIFLTAANIEALVGAEAGALEHRDRAASYLLDSLRLGLDVSQLPASGPLADIVEQIRASEEYQAAVADGSRAVRAPIPGLVDSLAGTE